MNRRTAPEPARTKGPLTLLPRFQVLAVWETIENATRSAASSKANEVWLF